MKIKWKFWTPSDGYDEKGDTYFRAGAWQSVSIEYLKIFIFLIALTIFGKIMNW